MRSYSALRAVLGCGLALLLAAGVGAAQEPKLPDGLRHVPLDAMGFIHFRAGDLLKSAVGKALLQELQQAREAKQGLKKIEQTLGIEVADLESVTLLMLAPTHRFFNPLEMMPKQPMPLQDMDRFGVGDRDPNPLVMVTSTKPLDRMKILKSHLFAEQPRDLLAPSTEPSVLFLSDSTVMIGMPWELARYTDVVARKSAPKTQPMKSALALGAEPHLVVAGGYLPPELRQMVPLFGQQTHLFAAAAPLFHTDAALTVDLDTSFDLTLQFQAPSEAGAAMALQALKSLRVMMELSLEKHREIGEPSEWQRELQKAVPKALAEASIEQKGTTVRAKLKMDVKPAFFKRFTKEIVESFRRKGDRTVSVNNLKQIGLAIHNYHDTYKRLPPAAISSVKNRDGKPLLSWRVAILPYIEQGPLYSQFDLDQPWDHPANKKLIAKMPPIYLMPGVDVKEGMTHYRTLVGPDTMLDPIPGPNGMLVTRYRLSNIPDGTSNTIMAVEARDPTIWTRPDDLPYDPKGPLPKFGISPDGFHVLLGDGSVRFIRSTISEATLRAAITCSDGMPLGADWDR